GPLAHALAASFADLHRTPWAGEVPLARFDELLGEAPRRVPPGEPEHLPAAAVLFSPALARTLLCPHSTGIMCVQLGGHMEPGDLTRAAGALREAREESGLSDFRLLHPAPIELNHHGLAATFGACQAHFDVVFALTTSLA